MHFLQGLIFEVSYFPEGASTQGAAWVTTIGQISFIQVK